MARLTGGYIPLGDVSKNVRYIAGAYNQEERGLKVKKDQSQPSVTVIKKGTNGKKILKARGSFAVIDKSPKKKNKNGVLYVTMQKKTCAIGIKKKWKSSIVKYSFQDKYKDACVYNNPFALTDILGKKVYFWVEKEDGASAKLSIFFQDKMNTPIEVLETKGPSKILKDKKEEAPVKEENKIQKPEVGQDNGSRGVEVKYQMIDGIPTEIRQNLWELCDDMEYISESSRFLFREDFMKRFYAEFEYPEEDTLQKMLKVMDAVEIMEMINTFNKMGFPKKNQSGKIIAPTKWLWNHIEYDGVHLISSGWWASVYENDVAMISIQQTILGQKEEMEDRFTDSGKLWDDCDTYLTFYVFANEKQGIISNLFAPYPVIGESFVSGTPNSHSKLLQKLNKQFHEASVKYLRSKGVGETDIKKLNRRTAINCAYVMKLLIKENGLDLDTVLKKIYLYQKLINNPSQDLLDEVLPLTQRFILDSNKDK